jgi:hypothetical protein
MCPPPPAPPLSNKDFGDFIAASLAVAVADFCFASFSADARVSPLCSLNSFL